jgi:hypothetical protein
MNHFTNREGYNGIRAQVVWVFVAYKPLGDNPKGAYFTTLTPDTPNLAQRLRIPREKIKFIFTFTGGEDLSPLDGGRGRYIFYSDNDYQVEKERQTHHGETGR